MYNKRIFSMSLNHSRTRTMGMANYNRASREEIRLVRWGLRSLGVILVAVGTAVLVLIVLIIVKIIAGIITVVGIVIFVGNWFTWFVNFIALLPFVQRILTRVISLENVRSA